MTPRSIAWLAARPIAHRGLHDRAAGVIENSRSAFAAAIAAGYAIECDLQLTADGAAVVFHDETLDRLTEAKGAVASRTAAEMRGLTLSGGADRVQTLDELLRQVDGRTPLVIELKSHWDGNQALARRAVDVLSSYRGAVALMSFDPDMMEAVRRLSPAMLRGMVGDRAFDAFYDTLPVARARELRTLAYLDRTAPDFVSFYYRELPYAPILALRRAGLAVISWTIRTPAQARDALRYSDQVTFEGYRA